MNILMFTHNMDMVNGGMTFALKRRAEVLSEEGHNVSIVTHGFSVNEQLNPFNYKVTNIFDYYAQFEGQILEKDKIYYDDEIKYIDKNGNNCFRVFSQGEYKQYRQYDDNHNLKLIDFFKIPWKRTKKSLFFNNKIVKTFYMDDTNKPKIAKYINNNNCYITSIVNPKDWKDTLIYNHTNSTEFTIFDFKFQFLKNYIIENQINLIFIDKREDIELFLKIKSYFPNMKLIFVLHSTHYKDPIKHTGVHETLNPLFDNIDSFHKIIILTDEQRNEIINKFGNENKFEVLSNILDYKDLENRATSRKRLISIGRFEDVKNMSEIIHIFDLVAKQIDGVQLDLYGHGSQKKQLENLAKGKNIVIHDFCNNPREVMKYSSAFLFTSKYEGQGLVLLECYDAKCPIFSYNVKFGAKNIIKNCENGMISQYGNRNQMVKQIIDYIQGKYSFKFEYKCSEVFSKDKYISNLKRMIDEN